MVCVWIIKIAIFFFKLWGDTDLESNLWCLCRPKNHLLLLSSQYIGSEKCTVLHYGAHLVRYIVGSNTDIPIKGRLIQALHVQLVIPGAPDVLLQELVSMSPSCKNESRANLALNNCCMHLVEPKTLLFLRDFITLINLIQGFCVSSTETSLRRGKGPG